MSTSVEIEAEDHGLHPDLFTVKPDEPVEWAEELDWIRDASIAEGFTLYEAQKRMFKRLTVLRADRHTAFVAAQTPTYEPLEYSRPTAPGRELLTEPEANTLAGVVTWAEWRDNTPDEPEYLVHGLISIGSQGFLASRPKAGKSWLAAHLGVSIASGKPFLNRFEIAQPRPVLYVCLEGSQSSMRARIGAIARGVGVNPDNGELANLHMRGRGPIDLSDPKYAEQITNTARELGAALVIVDTLRKAAPRIRETGDGAQDFNILVANLANLPSIGCAVLFTHHFVKASANNAPRSLGEMLTGSGSLFGHADYIIGIVKTEKLDGRISTMALDFDGREEATPEPFVVTLTGEATSSAGGWGYRDTLTLTTESASKASLYRKTKTELQAVEILNWLSAERRPVTPKEVREQFSLSSDALTKIRKEHLDTLGLAVTGKAPNVTWEYAPKYLPTTPGLSLDDA